MAKNLPTDSDYDEDLNKAKSWDNIWRLRFKEYQNDFRHAYYIAAARRRRERRMLEIAAGSFRDMAALNRWGLFCEGVDFSIESIEKARETHIAFSGRIKKMDAACLGYADGAFDLTFHNGFWGYFDDERISVLGAEQARVTAYRMVATVHNAHNKSFKKRFAVLSETDPLYRIRFFYKDEISNLMRLFCRCVKVMPVTGGKMDRLIHLGLGPKSFRWAYRLYGCYEPYEKYERLMCIGEVY